MMNKTKSGIVSPTPNSLEPCERAHSSKGHQKGLLRGPEAIKRSTTFREKYVRKIKKDKTKSIQNSKSISYTSEKSEEEEKLPGIQESRNDEGSPISPGRRTDRSVKESSSASSCSNSLFKEILPEIKTK